MIASVAAATAAAALLLLLVPGAAAAAVVLQGGTCAPDHFMCLGGEGCVPRSVVCDGTNDCDDGTDEYDCPTDQPDGAGECVLRCGAAGAAASPLCLPAARLCDGVADCADSADERNCSSLGLGRANWTGAATATPEERCRPDEHRCLDGTCISLERLCDTNRDCFDGSDELPGCLQRLEAARAAAAAAATDSSLEVPQADAEEPVDSAAEAPATVATADPGAAAGRNCTADEFRCGDGKCIAAGRVCDERRDCADGSDEAVACPTRLPCRDGFKCARDGRCIARDWVCDGSNDCSDGSDEAKWLCSEWAQQPAPPAQSHEEGARLREPLVEHVDRCGELEPTEQRRCHLEELHRLQVEELQLRQLVARQELHRVKEAVVADKALAEEELQAAELRRQAALDSLRQQSQLHRLRLQELLKLGGATPQPSPSPQPATSSAETASENI